MSIRPKIALSNEFLGHLAKFSSKEQSQLLKRVDEVKKTGILLHKTKERVQCRSPMRLLTSSFHLARAILNGVEKATVTSSSLANSLSSLSSSRQNHLEIAQFLQNVANKMKSN